MQLAARDARIGIVIQSLISRTQLPTKRSDKKEILLLVSTLCVHVDENSVWVSFLNFIRFLTLIDLDPTLVTRNSKFQNSIKKGDLSANVGS